MEGLVIMTFVIVNLIAAYLFRDWIMQNMPAEQPAEEEVNNPEQNEIDQHAVDFINMIRQAADQQEGPAEWQGIHRRHNNLPNRFVFPEGEESESEEENFFGNTNDDMDHDDEHYRHFFHEDERPEMEEVFDERPAVPQRNVDPVEPILLPRRQQQINVEAPVDMGDEAIGILEAVGFRGSPWMMVQNSALLSLVMCVCLGVAVWIPYVIGRCMILVTFISLS